MYLRLHMQIINLYKHKSNVIKFLKIIKKWYFSSKSKTFENFNFL